MDRDVWNFLIFRFMPKEVTEVAILVTVESGGAGKSSALETDAQTNSTDSSKKLAVLILVLIVFTFATGTDN